MIRSLYQVLPMALYDLIILGQDVAEEELIKVYMLYKQK